MTTEAKTPLMQQYDRLKQLKADAVPTSEDDWGTERQVEAEIAFYNAVEEAISADDYDQMSDVIEGYKLDISEALDYSMNCVAFGVEFATEKLGK